jgi:hypothetical protein
VQQPEKATLGLQMRERTVAGKQQWPEDNFDRDLTRINLAMSIFAGMWPGKVMVL